MKKKKRLVKHRAKDKFSIIILASKPINVESTSIINAKGILTNTKNMPISEDIKIIKELSYLDTLFETVNFLQVYEKETNNI
ncbi:10840_t:CDS:2 [Funneliformis caledonium]|uniref:10840_t:CDS:1 n=1 Tax=Funneliformis caledonium TaxID=1117310 RepID=A0A9N9CIY7_9GLOM|nr:10840_t:CDS:2 [Funneliformis caledonium]